MRAVIIDDGHRGRCRRIPVAATFPLEAAQEAYDRFAATTGRAPATASAPPGRPASWPRPTWTPWPTPPGGWATSTRRRPTWSTFVGYDLAEDAVARARSKAAAAGLANARFEVRDAAGLTVDEPFDVVFVFDAIHDQVDPAAVLGRIHAALAPGGIFVMVEPRASSDLAGA